MDIRNNFLGGYERSWVVKYIALLYTEHCGRCSVTALKKKKKAIACWPFSYPHPRALPLGSTQLSSKVEMERQQHKI